MYQPIQRNTAKAGGAAADHAAPRNVQLKQGLRGLDFEAQSAALAPEDAAVQREESGASDAESAQGGAARVAVKMAEKLAARLPSLPEDLQGTLQSFIDRLYAGKDALDDPLQEWGQAMREQSEKDKASALEQPVRDAYHEARLQEQLK